MVRPCDPAVRAAVRLPSLAMILLIASRIVGLACVRCRQSSTPVHFLRKLEGVLAAFGA